jgi:hypothetical protein
MPRFRGHILLPGQRKSRLLGASLSERMRTRSAGTVCFPIVVHYARTTAGVLFENCTGSPSITLRDGLTGRISIQPCQARSAMPSTRTPGACANTSFRRSFFPWSGPAGGWQVIRGGSRNNNLGFRLAHSSPHKRGAALFKDSAGAAGVHKRASWSRGEGKTNGGVKGDRWGSGRLSRRLRRLCAKSDRNRAGLWNAITAA